MRKIWSDERKFQIWLEIEILACEAMAELGQIPKADAAEIRKRARFSIPEILERPHKVLSALRYAITSREKFYNHMPASVAQTWFDAGLSS